MREELQAAKFISKNVKPCYIPSDTDEQEQPQKQPSLADIIIEAYKQRAGDAEEEGEQCKE